MTPKLVPKLIETGLSRKIKQLDTILFLHFLHQYKRTIEIGLSGIGT